MGAEVVESFQITASARNAFEAKEANLPVEQAFINLLEINTAGACRGARSRATEMIRRLSFTYVLRR